MSFTWIISIVAFLTDGQNWWTDGQNWWSDVASDE